MKISNYQFIVLALLVIMLSCSKRNQEQDALTIYNESMKIHDLVMPRVDEVLVLKQKLTSRIDSLKTDSIKNAASIREMVDARANLIQAHENMMQWMHHIKDVPGATSVEHHGHHDSHSSTHAESAPATDTEDVIKVQKDQRAAIEKISQETAESISKAKQVLQLTK